MDKKKNKLLTTGFDEQTMAEFSVSASLLGARSVNALVHQMVFQKIAEAKNLVTKSEFEQLVQEQKEQTAERSRRHQRVNLPGDTSENRGSEKFADNDHLKMLGELAPHSKKSLPMIEATVEPVKKKKIA